MILRTSTSILAAFVMLTALAAPATAQEGHEKPAPAPSATPLPRKTIVYTPRSASDFAFMVPGKTTIEKTAETLGDTIWAYRSFLIEHTIIPYLDVENLIALYEEAGDRSVDPVEVRVYTAGPRGNLKAYFVFKKGVLLYGHFPVSSSEKTREQIEARWGKKLDVFTELPMPRVETVLYSTHLLRIPGETSFFYWEDRQGVLEDKVIHTPESKVEGFKRGDIRKPPQP